MRNLQINGERLWVSLMELARIGATEKGPRVPVEAATRRSIVGGEKCIT